MTDSLDAIDRMILQIMSADARIAWNELASQVGLSITPTLRRVRMMERRGIIKGYAAILDETILLGSMGVIIGITLDKQVRSILDNFEERVARMPEIVSGSLMSGSQDYMLKAFVRDLTHYRDFLSRLTMIEGIAHIHSSFILKSFIDK